MDEYMKFFYIRQVYAKYVGRTSGKFNFTLVIIIQ